MKPGIFWSDWPPLLVAPLAGAWIETAASLVLAKLDNVAPLAGAWIETGSIIRSFGC